MMFPPAFFESVKPNGRLARGRDYSDPIDVMVRAIPPGTPINPTAITAELYDVGLWNLALITASMGLIMERVRIKIANGRDDDGR